MRFVRVVLTAALVAAGAVALTPVAAVAAPPSAPYDAYIANGEFETVLRPGPGDAAFNTIETDNYRLSVRTGTTYLATFEAPLGATLTTGTFPFGQTRTATQMVFYGSGPCFFGDGTLTISELVRTGAAVTALAASINWTNSANCYGGGNGEVRYHSSVGFAASAVSTHGIQYAQQTMNEPPLTESVTVTAKGSDPLTIGAASIANGDPGAFTITGDGCAGQTLAYDESCTISVRAETATQGDHGGQLSIPDNAGGKRVSLRAKVIWPVNATVTPGFVNFDYVEVNVEAPPIISTVTATGPNPLVLGAISVPVQPAKAIFAIIGDTCSLHTLAVGETCQVVTKAKPLAVGQSNWTWTIPSNTFSGVGANVSVLGYEKPGGYYEVSPARLLDTRIGLGAPTRPLGPNSTLTLQVTGRGGVPAENIAAVVLNVTVTGPTAGSYLTAFPTGEANPGVSSLNFPKGWTGANSVTVKVGAGGKVSLYNAKGSVQVIADVTGFYAGAKATIDAIGVGSTFFPVSPQRVFDSRDEGGPLGGHDTVGLALDFGEVSPHITAIAINLTATGPTGNGYLAAWDGTGDLPDTSVLNFTAGRTVPNLAIVPVTDCGYFPDCADLRQLAVYNGSSQPVHVLVDVVGYYADNTVGGGLGFLGKTPYRLWDTRSDAVNPPIKPIGQNQSIQLQPPYLHVDYYAAALALNVTAVSPTANTFLTVWPSDEVRPLASNLNPAKGQTVPNAVIAQLPPFTPSFSIYNAKGNTHVIVDVVGSFVTWTTPPPSWHFLGLSNLARATATATAAPASAPKATRVTRLPYDHAAQEVGAAAGTLWPR